MDRFPELLGECTGFQWDAGNGDKNWRTHRISRAEAEQVSFDRPVVRTPVAPHQRPERAATEDGRGRAWGC